VPKGVTQTINAKKKAIINPIKVTTENRLKLAMK